jgi:hypothetical protein
MQKTKTQITINNNLATIVASVQKKYPIYDINGAVEYLLALGSGIYLQNNGLSLQDLKDINISRQEITDGMSVKVDSAEALLSKLKA